MTIIKYVYDFVIHATNNFLLNFYYKLLEKTGNITNAFKN